MNRLPWVDNAKAVGMFLVFYGHIIEQVLYKAGGDRVFLQYKLIYAFHMPLFFVLSGFFARIEPITSERFSGLALRRFLPVLTFGVLLLPLWPIHFLVWQGRVPWQEIGNYLLDYFHGAPRLDWITWFLVCLLSCELLAGVFLPYLKGRFRVAAFGAVCLLFGLFVCNHLPVAERVLGIKKNTWFIHEAIVALGFYALGHAVFPVLQSIRSSRRIYAFLFLIGSIVLLWTTFELNAPRTGFSVTMAGSRHGLILPFIVSALAGTCSVIALAMILPATRPARFIGRNTIIFLGMNGVFFHFINPRLAAHLAPPDTHFEVIAYCGIVAALSLLVTSPAALLMQRWIPQLVGAPNKSGPIFPNLESWIKGVLSTASRRRAENIRDRLDLQ